MRRALAAEETFRFVLGTYVVARYARIRRGLRVPPGKDLIIGMGARIEGPVRGASNVFLASGVRIHGPVEADLDVVLGAGSRVEGDVEAGGNVYLQDGSAIAGRLHAGGLARIVGGFVSGPVDVGGDVEVGDGAVLHEVRAGGRIRTLPGTNGASEETRPGH